MAATPRDSGLPAGSGQEPESQGRPGPGLSWGWAGASGTGPRLVVFWPLLVGPPSACSSDLLVSFWETEAEAKEGFCHPLHVPLTHLSHIFYIKR